MEAKPTQLYLRCSWRRSPRSYPCGVHGGEAHAAIPAVFMEAKPTQYAVIMEAHDQVVSELEAHRTGDCTG